MPEPPLRPLGFGETLDGAFTIYRRHFAALFATALLPVLPVVAFWALLALLAGGAVEELAGAAQLVILPYTLLTGLLVTAALMQQSSSAVLDEPVSIEAGYRRALRRFLPLLGASIVTGILIVLGFLLLIVPGILLTLMFFAVGQVVVIEGRGPLEALGRSRELARNGWLRIFGIILVAWLIVALPSMAIGIAAAIAAAGFGSPWVAYIFQALTPLVSALTTPFSIAAYVLLYYDRRARRAPETGAAGGEPAPAH